jgi:simple sugar transport system permease protein
VSYSLPGLPPLDIPGLSEIPVIGRILFHQDAVTYLGLSPSSACGGYSRPAWA